MRPTIIASKREAHGTLRVYVISSKDGVKIQIERRLEEEEPRTARLPSPLKKKTFSGELTKTERERARETARAREKFTLRIHSLPYRQSLSAESYDGAAALESRV